MPTPLCPIRPPCPADQICPGCYGRELGERRPQARAQGAVWAERICRGDLRGRDWPAGTAKTLAIARRLVAPLARDERVLDELARTCDEGAAAWWAIRPARYRL